MNTIFCTCCNAELTMPQYHNGKPYGYTCITKVCPDHKPEKIKWARLNVLKVERVHPAKEAFLCEYNGKKAWVDLLTGSHGVPSAGQATLDRDSGTMDLAITCHIRGLSVVVKCQKLDQKFDFSELIKSRKRR